MLKPICNFGNNPHKTLTIKIYLKGMKFVEHMHGNLKGLVIFVILGMIQTLLTQ